MSKKKVEPAETEISSAAQAFAASEVKAAREAAEAHAKAQNAERIARTLRIMAELADSSHKSVTTRSGIAAMMTAMHAEVLRDAADLIAPKRGKWSGEW